MLKSLTSFVLSCAMSKVILNIWEYLSFMVKVNISVLLTVGSLTVYICCLVLFIGIFIVGQNIEHQVSSYSSRKLSDMT